MNSASDLTLIIDRWAACTSTLKIIDEVNSLAVASFVNAVLIVVSSLK